MAILSSVLPAHQARANFYQLLSEAGDQLRQFTITLRGKAKAVLMSAEEFDGWLETLEIMSNKKLSKSIEKALKSKKVYTQQQVDNMIGW